MNTMIVYYSWTGNTHTLALALKDALPGAECFRLTEKKERLGSKGFAVAGMQATLGVCSRLTALPDLSGVSTVLLGTPVWGGMQAAAVNTFLKSADLSGKQIFLFCTQQGNDTPARCRQKVQSKVEKKGGRFVTMLTLKVPYKQVLSPEKAAKIAAQWKESILPGEKA